MQEEKIVEVQIAFWDQNWEYKTGDLNLAPGDLVVVKTEWGLEVARIVAKKEMPKQPIAEQGDLIEVIRKATTEDLENIAEFKKQEPAALDFCKKLVEKYSLPMKIIDSHISLDGGRLIFPFIADGRVDFRSLVKDLTHHFQKSIRLQQIGIRDEAKICGDIGSCGRTLCCKTHLKCLASITSELADVQQIAHRGSERLSGLCGRLRCCLAYESQTYQELAKNMPALGSSFKTPQGQGQVVAQNILKQTVNVAINGDRGNVVEVPINK